MVNSINITLKNWKEFSPRVKTEHKFFAYFNILKKEKIISVNWKIIPSFFHQDSPLKLTKSFYSRNLGKWGEKIRKQFMQKKRKSISWKFNWYFLGLKEHILSLKTIIFFRNFKQTICRYFNGGVAEKAIPLERNKIYFILLKSLSTWLFFRISFILELGPTLEIPWNIFYST